MMGARIDSLGPAAALRMVAALGGILAVIFGGMFFYFKARGGYRAINLGTDRPMAGGEL
jgi:hypothetical protein